MAPPAGVSRGPSFASRVSGYSVDPSAPSSSLTPIAATPVGTAPPSAVATPADETAILTRGPDIMALGEYFAAMDAVVADLERMWRGLMEGRGGAREAGVKDLSRLVEVGLSGSVGLFLKIAREGAGRIADPEALVTSGESSITVEMGRVVSPKRDAGLRRESRRKVRAGVSQRLDRPLRRGEH